MIWDAVIAGLLGIGSLFILVGSIGLVKLDTPMKRVHAPTKASTLGVGSLLLASMIHAFTHASGSLHELLIMGFLFVTAPISGHFIAKVNLHLENVDPAPPPPGDRTWATFETDSSDRGVTERVD